MRRCTNSNVHVAPADWRVPLSLASDSGYNPDVLRTDVAVALGLLVGLRHAFEPDHLAAVTTLVVRSRSAGHGAVLGAMWGLGHTATLLVVGGVLIATGALVPVQAAAAFELAVAVMLIGLGVHAIVLSTRNGASRQSLRHEHRTDTHEHATTGAQLHVENHRLRWRPFLIGVVHGLAGTGAITALVLVGLPDLVSRVTYLALFGVGSVVGMTASTAFLGATLVRFAASRRSSAYLGIAVGGVSVALGIAWSVPALSAL
jgi:High-affinity nickel-transport protein